MQQALLAMVEAVRAAGRICRDVQAELVASDSVRKEDRSPVTVADLASQAVIAHRLAEAFPDVPLAGEEDSSVLDGDERRVLREAVLTRVAAEWAGASEAEVRQAIDGGCGAGGAAGRFFTVDPIDGTKGFLRGEQYAVALALIEDGRVVAGALGCPNLEGPGESPGAVLFAARGQGTRVGALDGHGLDGPAARRSTIDDPSALRLCESVESGHTDQTTSRLLRERLGVTAPPVRIDSQCKYALLARGEAELYLRVPTVAGRAEWIWDHAAGAIVVEEAGGRVTDLDGRPLDFGRGRRLDVNRGIVATNGLLHDRVLDAMKGRLEA